MKRYARGEWFRFMFLASIEVEHHGTNANCAVGFTGMSVPFHPNTRTRGIIRGQPSKSPAPIVSMITGPPFLPDASTIFSVSIK